jgi:chorismate mutase
MPRYSRKMITTPGLSAVPPVQEIAYLLDRRQELSRQIAELRWQTAKLEEEDRAARERMREVSPLLPPEPEALIEFYRTSRSHLVP